LIYLMNSVTTLLVVYCTLWKVYRVLTYMYLHAPTTTHQLTNPRMNIIV
jgi:hypothetical protein